MAAGQAYFDDVGNQVCSDCHDREEISASDPRVEDRRLEDASVSAYDVSQKHAAPWCPRCRDYLGVLRSATHSRGDGHRPDARHFVCSRCGQSIR